MLYAGMPAWSKGTFASHANMRICEGLDAISAGARMPATAKPYPGVALSKGWRPVSWRVPLLNATVPVLPGSSVSLSLMPRGRAMPPSTMRTVAVLLPVVEVLARMAMKGLWRSLLRVSDSEAPGATVSREAWRLPQAGWGVHSKVCKGCPPCSYDGAHVDPQQPSLRPRVLVE